MGFNRHFAWQQSSGPNVRFGSKADVGLPPVDVRYSPKSGHQEAAPRHVGFPPGFLGERAMVL